MTTCTHSYTESGTCPVCRFEPFARNHYFDGKFMVARDFTDEQRYYVDKLRHHNARLHGSGVVCGLKVKQHPNEACRDRFVCIEPGTAIDCCGHEIIIPEEECVDIATLAAIKALKEKNDTATHTLQICVRYKDCPTEDVPVLYDECGCDETKCAPNRILESYEFDVILDPKLDGTPIRTPKIEWEHTLNIAHASRVAAHEASKRLYVMSVDAPGIVYQLDTATHTTITSHNLPAKALASAISSNGERLYIVAEPVAPATERQLYVLNTTQPGLPAVQSTPLTIPSSAGNDVVLAVEPSGRLLALIGNAAGDLRRWDVDIDTQATPAASVVVASLGANLTALALSGDGAVAYAAGTSRSIQSVAIETGTKTTITDILPTSAQASALALVKSTGPDLLSVADKTGNTLHLVAPSPASLVGTVILDHLPVTIAVSPGGHSAYVLEQDTVAKESYVQIVNLHAVQQHLPTAATPKFKVSHPAQQLIMVEAGRRLYIPFTGDMNQPASGGVAILDISEEACEEILWRHLEGCPPCDIPNCVVLATITEYKLGTKIQESAIDNRRGRRVLASTEILQEWIECLSEHPAGGAGVAGPQGPPGAPGTSVKSADAETVNPGEPADADFAPGTGHIHFKIPKGEKGEPGVSVKTADAETVAPGTPADANFNPVTGNVHFKIPKGEKGDPGGTGIIGVDLRIVDCSKPSGAQISPAGILELVIPTSCGSALTHICSISWVHGGSLKVADVREKGLLIAFDGSGVEKSDFHERSVMVLISHEEQVGHGVVTCWCEVAIRRTPKILEKPCDLLSNIRDPKATDKVVNAIQIKFMDAGAVPNSGMVRVILNGDFIRDKEGKGLDADHLPPWFPTKNYKTGDGIAGGTFESWFVTKPD